jgi:hypothetical protein
MTSFAIALVVLLIATLPATATTASLDAHIANSTQTALSVVFTTHGTRNDADLCENVNSGFDTCPLCYAVANATYTVRIYMYVRVRLRSA